MKTLLFSNKSRKLAIFLTRIKIPNIVEHRQNRRDNVDKAEGFSRLDFIFLPLKFSVTILLDELNLKRQEKKLLLPFLVSIITQVNLV